MPIFIFFINLFYLANEWTNLTGTTAGLFSFRFFRPILTPQAR